MRAKLIGIYESSNIKYFDKKAKIIIYSLFGCQVVAFGVVVVQVVQLVKGVL